MIGYASRTGTKRNLTALQAAGWRLLVSAAGVWRTEGMRYALDNGAWSAFQQGRPLDEDRFRELVERFGADADFVVAPDVVCGGVASLDYSLGWLSWCLERTRLVLLAVQNGMTAELLRPHVGHRVGIFVGGDTAWKESSLPVWGGLKRETGCYLHVGRVNSARRIRLCALAGADSFDGTSVTRFANTIGLLDGARRQQVFDFGGGDEG